MKRKPADIAVDHRDERDGLAGLACHRQEVRDVGRVQEGAADERSAVRQNGRDAISAGVSGAIRESGGRRPAPGEEL